MGHPILEGYRRSFRAGGYPVVLAEREQKLGKLGVDSSKPPTGFWEKLDRLPGSASHFPSMPDEVERTVEKDWKDYRKS